MSEFFRLLADHQVAVHSLNACRDAFERALAHGEDRRADNANAAIGDAVRRVVEIEIALRGINPNEETRHVATSLNSGMRRLPAQKN